MGDVAAVLGEARRPPELQSHVEGIVAGLEGNVSKEADPVLSAWMFYDRFARSLEDNLSKYWKKVKRLKAAALISMRDLLGASHDILAASGHHADARAVARAYRLLD